MSGGESETDGKHLSPPGAGDFGPPPLFLEATGKIWRRGKRSDIIPAVTQVFSNPVKFLSLLPLLPAEREFARCLAEGNICKVGGIVGAPKVMITVGNAVNVIRGEVIRFFACGGDRDNPVSGRAIHLQGGWISGRVNLSHANIPVALGFHHCHFDEGVYVRHAECIALYMNGCYLAKGLAGYGMKVKGSVFMRRFSSNDVPFDFLAKGEVQLTGAHIGGDLDCRGGKFECLDGDALNAERATVKGDVRLSHGFSAKGGVHFMGADIGGQLDCAGGRFVNKGDSNYALNAERVKTGGHVYLNQHEFSGGKEPFTAFGRVRFANAHIGGNFNCKGGRFLHSGKQSALAAGGLKSRAVFLSEGFSAEGEVALHVAHVGNFVCAGCAPNDKSPITINLSSTEAAAVDDDKESWEPFNFLLDGFTYGTFYGLSPTDSKRRLEWLSKRPDKRTLKDGTEADIPFSPLPYEQAAKVLFGMGQAREAREILLEKERLQTKDERTPWHHKIGRRLWDVFAGYGYRLRKTAAWMAGFVLAGAVFFGIAAHHGKIVPHQPPILSSAEYQAERAKELSPMESAQAAFPKEYPEFSPLAYSLDVFIPFFALHQEPFWSPASGWDSDLWKASLLLALLAAAALALGGLASLFANRIRRECGDGFTGAGAAGVGLAAVSLLLGLDFAAGFAHAWLDFDLVAWLADWRWLTVWHWLEIGAGWVLTSLFLLSITGLLRPRQSSGEKG